MNHVATLIIAPISPHVSRCHWRRRHRRCRLLLRQQELVVWVLLFLMMTILSSWYFSREVAVLLQPVHAGRHIVAGRKKRSASAPATSTVTSSNNNGTAWSSTISMRLQRHWSRWNEWWQAENTKSTSDKDPLLATEMAAGNQVNKKKTEKEPKRQKRTAARNGRQKMQRCHHLATSTTKQTPSRLYRLWKRGRNLIRKQRRRWRRRFFRRRNNGVTIDDATESDIDLPLRSHSYSRDINLAYSMAAMASLSYWPFHKKPLPDNRLSFELMTIKNGRPAPLHKQKQRGRRRKRDQAMRMALKGMAAALKQTSPWLPRSHRNRQNKGSYREWWQSTIQDRLLKEEKQQQQQQVDHRIQLEYALYNWYEPTTLGLNYHDTDLLVATSNNGKTLMLAFAGSDSVPDTVTNLQTFESVQHMGGLFHSVAANGPSSSKMASMNTTSDGRLEGSIHRGFLNAYSRTERGSILKLCEETNNCTSNLSRQSILKRRYGHCGIDSGSKDETQCIPEEKDFDQYDVAKAERQTTFSNSTGAPVAETKQKEEEIVKKRGRRGCKVKDNKLMDILRELVTEYLSSGKSVLLTGHSLGGSLATILALDMVMNFPQVPVDKLQLWTFGGAQIADSRFLESALSLVPRLQSFLEQDSRQKWMQVVNPTFHPRSQFHRFVTVSDDCQVDFISTVAQNLLSPENEKNIHGKTARKLGGILEGGSIVHFAEPHYLLTPDQYTSLDGGEQPLPLGNEDPSTEPTTVTTTNTKQSATRSSLSAHATSNYLHGISRESKDHPLITDFPPTVRAYLGEAEPLMISI